MKKYIVHSFNTSNAKSDEQVADWLNDNAAKGYSLHSLTKTRDNERDFVTAVMEHQPITTG